MFLKNDSNFKCGLRTKKEVLTLNPGDVVFVLDSDIISINSKLSIVTEQEFNKLAKSTTSEELPDSVLNEKIDVNEPLVNPEPEQITIVNPEPEQINQNSELVENSKVKIENVNVPKSELEQLEETLESLKQKWEQAEKPGKKAQIQKKIKAVQEEIAKLQG